jgi:hypothetical protein
MKTKTAVLSSLFCAGLLLGTAQLAQANTLITFQVDMTYQVQNNTFTNGVDSVYVRGSFSNNFAGPGFLLTNNPAVNTNFYTGTYNDITDTNGGQLQYKYLINAAYETTGNYGNNRVTLLPVTSGSSLVLPYQFFSDAAYSVNPIAPPCVFQVDMAQQIQLGTFNPNTMQVGVNGYFNSFTADANLLTNDPTILRTNQFNLVTSNVYVGTVSLVGSPGEVNEFKYTIQPANEYEAPSALNGLAQNNNNRFVFVVSNQVLPVVFFSDQPYAPIGTNQYTFSVDMTAQALSGALSNNTQVTLQGDFNNWTGQNCTNNPNASNTNIYYATTFITNGVGAITQFKFLLSGNYEANPIHTYPGNPSILGGNQNREFADPASTGTNIILPTVRYNDLSTNTLLPVPTMVTFSVNMTNAVGTDSSVFNPSTDNVYLNGMDITNSVGFYSFDTWTNSVILSGANGYTNALAAFQMVNNPIGSEIYTITVPVPSGSIPAGYPLELSYQYTFGNNSGLAIESLGAGNNHIRYIRSTGGTYVLPEDTFGSMVQEPAFGNLAAGAKSGGNVPITWLGLPHVHLQTVGSLTNGTWTDLLGTDGQNSTNYPVGAGPSYFRLINPF